MLVRRPKCAPGCEGCPFPPGRCYAVLAYEGLIYAAKLGIPGCLLFNKYVDSVSHIGKKIGYHEASWGGL